MKPSRRKSKAVKGRKKPGKVISALIPEESKQVLETLLAQNPNLIKKAKKIAEPLVAEVNVESLARKVEKAVLSPDLDDLHARAGSWSHGYVEPSQAAWDILAEAVQPFFEDLERRVKIGYQNASVEICQGIILGLYRCRDEEEGLLAWASDFLEESACDAVAMLLERSKGKQKRLMTIPEDFFEVAPEWKEMLERVVDRYLSLRRRHK
jgi:hypothetical protein